MHIPSVFAAISLLGLATSAVLPRQDEAYAGYLLSVFTDPDPSVFWYLSDASDPLAFTPLNGGDSVLASTVGTKAVRDVFLTSNEDRSEYTLIATDLDINVDGFSWDEATRRGSRGLVVWKSENLLDWSEPTLSIVEDPTAGMAWAPSVVYNTTESQYYLFWASRLYSEDDTEHTGDASLDRIRYATTTDFTTFSAPADYVALDSENVPLIDQEFLYLGTPGHYARFLKDENPTYVYQETTEGGLFGQWTRNGEYVVETVYEGPAAFSDVSSDGTYYLFLDNYEEYVPFRTTDVGSGAWEQVTGSALPGGLKHGNVFLLTQAEYDAVKERYGS